MKQNSNPQRHTQARQIVTPLEQRSPLCASITSSTSLPFVWPDFFFCFFFLLLLLLLVIVVIIVVVWRIFLILLYARLPLQINGFHKRNKLPRRVSYSSQTDQELYSKAPFPTINHPYTTNTLLR